jgi:AraC family transcriptional regulator, arabinose operon regulatory protein
MDSVPKKLDDPMILKPHGFAHEHFVVVPGVILDESARHPLLHGLRVTDAGHFPRAAGHRVERPAGAETHLIFACLRGRGWVRGDPAAPIQSVEPGDVVWLPAGQAHAYGADATRPWTLTYAHFAGVEAEAWMRHGGWRGVSPELIRLPGGRVDELRLDRAYAALEGGYDVLRQVEAAAALRSALAVLGRLVAETGPARSARGRVVAARDRIRQEPAAAYRLGELAAEAGLSVPRFSQLFREIAGTSAIDYLLRVRIQRACQLLAATDATISEIAAEVGYDDAFYFTRCFRRVMSLSPRHYRSGRGPKEA